MELLEDVPHQYYELAILLGLKRSTVECFRLDYRDSPHRCLIAVLEHWVKNDTENISWSAVADALEQLHHRDVAMRIRSKYLHSDKTKVYTTLYIET